MKAWKIWVRLGAVMVMPLALVLVVETIARLSFVSALRWMLMPEAGSPLRYTYLVLIFAILALYAITNRLRWAAGFGFTLFTLCLVQVLSAHPGLFSIRTVPIYRKLTFVWRPEDNQKEWNANDPGIQNPDFSVAFNYAGFGLITGFRHREVKGKFISDNAVADEIIEVLDAATGPTFVWTITMQNHSPYGDNRYGDVEADTVWVKPFETPAPGVGTAGGGASPDATAISPRVNLPAVRDYVHGLRDADAMLEKLTRRFASSDRPVLLLFCGDHQPNLRPPDAEPGEFTQTE